MLTYDERPPTKDGDKYGLLHADFDFKSKWNLINRTTIRA